MRSPARALLGVVLLAVLAGPFRAPEASAAPYTIVTTDGQRVSVLDLPRNTGKVTKFRLHPDGRLSSFPSVRIDWKATEAANAPPAEAAATPVPSSVRSAPRVSALAGKLSVDESRANAGGDTMKLKSGKAADMNANGPYFGEKSVAQYLSIGELYFSSEGCPLQRAVFTGTVANSSKKKLRDLRALVLLFDQSTNRTIERMESVHPSNLGPGDEARIFLYLSCDDAHIGSTYLALLRDVSGTAEDLARPGRENPFAQPTPAVRK